MASLYVSEYSRFGRDDRGQTVPAAQEPAHSGQKMTISATAQNSTPFMDNTRIVEVQTDVVCHVKFYSDTYVKGGGSMAATSAHKRLPAGATQFFSVHPGMVVSVVEGV